MKYKIKAETLFKDEKGKFKNINLKSKYLLNYSCSIKFCS